MKYLAPAPVGNASVYILETPTFLTCCYKGMVEIHPFPRVFAVAVLECGYHTSSSFSGIIDRFALNSAATLPVFLSSTSRFTLTPHPPRACGRNSTIYPGPVWRAQIRGVRSEWHYGAGSMSIHTRDVSYVAAIPEL